MLQIQRHIYMGDMAGRPLGYGLAYFGEPDKDPKTYPIPTFFDKKGLIVAPEKIVVKSGFLYHNGNVVQVYAGRPNVSLLVEDKRGRQLGYFPQVAVPVIDGNGTDGNGGGGSGGGSGSGNGSGHGLGSGGGSGGGHGGVIVGSSDLPSVEQILDLLAEQISNDQLHKDLATSIAKIEPLNVDIDAIKAKIPDITQDIENAKAELAEAVASINAQRERITTANVNIEALDSAVKSLNLQLPIFSSRMTSAQNQLSQAVERINANKELINNNIRDIGTLTQKSETAKQEIAVLRTQKGELASSIEQVNTALSNAQETIAQQITNLQSQLDGNVAKIDGVKQAITNYQASIATQIEQVQSKFQIGIATTQANLDRYKQTQATEKEALTNLISTLDGAYKRADGVLTARIAQEEIARANADNANAQKIATLESKTKDTDSKIATLEQTQTTQQSALAESTRQINAKTDGVQANLEAFQQAQASKNEATAQSINSLQSRADNLSGQVNDIISSQANQHETLVQRIDSVSAEYMRADGNLSTRIANEERARADGDKVNASKVSALESKANVTNSKLSQLESAQSNQYQSIATRIDGLQTAYKKADTDLTVKVATETTARTQADEVLSTRITQLDAAYKQADATLTARLAHEEAVRVNGDNANAQKISTLESRAGRTEGKVATLERTTSDTNQAVTTFRTQLEARFDSLNVGGRNLLRNSQAERTVTNATTRENFVPAYALTKPLEPNTAYVLSYEYKTTNNAKTAQVGFVSSVGQHKFKSNLTKTVTWQKDVFKFTTGNNPNQAGHIRFDNEGTTNGQLASLWVKNAKLEVGTVPTDWTPAPEDVQADIDQKASTASLNTVRETLATADTALGRRIDAVSAEFKQADTTIKASVQTESQARTNADAAIAQTVNALQSDHNNNKSSVASQIKTLTDAKNSQATQISSLTANVTTAQNTANTAKDKADDGIRRASNAQNKADTATTKADNAQRTANTANSAITAEQRARANGDSSLASRITALDSKFTTADNTIKASVAQAQQTATNAQQAVATAQSQLNARFDNLAVGGRNLLRATANPASYRNFFRWGKVTKGGDFVRLVSDVVKNNGVFNGIKSTHTIKSGADYVVSFAYRTNAPNLAYIFVLADSGNLGLGQPANFVNDETWQKAVIARTAPRDLTNVRLLVGCVNMPVGTYIEVKDFKIEKGNIATDYTEAPEDVQSQLDEKASTASLDEYKQAQATKEQATAQRIAALDAAYKLADTTLTARMASEETARASADTALTGRIDSLQSTVNGNKSTVDTQIRTLSDKERAQATKLSQLESSLNTLDNRTKWTELTTTQNLNNLTTQGNYFIRAGNNTNSPTNPNTWLYVTVDVPRSDRLTQTAWADNNPSLRYVRTRHGTTWQGWQKQATGAELDSKASATALNNLTTKVNQVEGRITAEASKYNTLQTTVGQHTASIQVMMQSVNGLKSQYTLKVESGGVVSGIGLASENGKSRFAVRADVIDIVAPDGTKRPMFSVLTTPQTINGVSVPKGVYLDSAYIARGSINMLHIADSIQSDNYVAGRSGWRLFKNGTLEINSTFNDGTRIQLTSHGLVGFYANGQKAFELGYFT